MAVGASIATLSDILKKLYLPPVVEQLNNEVFLLTRFDRDNEHLYGEQAILPLHTTRSGGIGARRENEQLPAAGSQGYKKAVYDIVPLYARGRVSGFSMEKTASDSGAFLRALESEMDYLRNDIKLDMSRQIWGDGTGKIATCGTTTAANVVVLSNAHALRKGFIHIGMVVDIGTVAAPTTVASARNVTDVNVSAGTFTIDGAAVTTSSSHFVFRSGNADATGSKEILGVTGIVSDTTTTVGGIDPTQAGLAFWDNARDTSTSTLSLDALIQNFNQVELTGFSGGPNSTLAIGSKGIKRKLFGLLQSQVRYVNTLDLKAGYKALEVNGYPFVDDRHCPYGKVYLLQEKNFKVFSNRDWHFLDEDGKVIKWVPDFDAWQFVLARYMNVGTNMRKNQLVMTNLAGDDPNGF